MIELNGTLLAQIINFLILVVILTKVAYKPLMQALADRQSQIAESLDAAERARISAEEFKREYQEQLAQARIQAQEFMEKAIKQAEQSKEEILEVAREENTRLIKAAQQEIAREREWALVELKGEVVALSMAAATKIIAHNLDEQVNSQLVADFINNLDKEKNGNLPC